VVDSVCEYLFTCIQTCHSIIILWFCYFQLANIVEFVTALNNTNSEFHVDVDCLNVRVDRELTRTDDMQGSLILFMNIKKWLWADQCQFFV